MVRMAALLVALLLSLVLPGGALGAAPRFTPGAPGIGDPYFPLDGNGGYDVQHYRLNLRYDPATDRLSGSARITAVATQNLSRFNFDFDGLNVRSITVDGEAARWSRDEGELTVRPRDGIPNGDEFRVVVRYRGVPETLPDGSGFIHTDDGAVVIGEPPVASYWFPANDHPIDKASFTFRITVPAGLEAVSNGVLVETTSTGAWTTWHWEAVEPMAPYLATTTIGEFDLRAYEADGIRYWDAVDPDLYTAIATPRTGTQFAYSQQADSAYKRLARTISVPADGAQLSFWVDRDTEPGWDYFFVEAHPVGSDDWTTLPDENGHTTQDTGFVCPAWLSLHPFLEHYQTDNGDETCSPSGSTGDWWAISGASDGWEQWTVDLSAYAGGDVEVSLTYAVDESVQLPGVFVDDIEVSTGEGSTSFEADDDVLDGWAVLGAPGESPGNENDWTVGPASIAPPPLGVQIDASLGRQPEIIAFLSSVFGPYPFSAAGGIVDDAEIGFALENQTRPIYDKGFFLSPESGDDVVVHELAHQWYGDSLALARWRHIWLNEGFATYAEWLWIEHDGRGTAQEVFDFFYNEIPEDSDFWQLRIGNPGPDNLFNGAVYIRGAMTLHQLRLTVGDEDFFAILREWAQSKAGGNVTTGQFVRLAERISGQELDDLFELWLFTRGKPTLTSGSARAEQLQASASAPTSWLKASRR